MVCNKYGHGRSECTNITKINYLKQFHNDRLSLENYCTIDGCKYKWSHTYKSHHCHKCFRNHSSKECIIQTFNNHKEQFTMLNSIDINTIFHNKNNVFIKYYIGMGCHIYIRKKNTIESIFMHSDSWGQYGPKTDDSPLFYSFINELTDITDITNPNKTSNVQCPICRKINYEEHVLDIKGSSDKCTICLDKNVEVYFSNCNHAVVCKICYNNIKN